MLIPGRINSRRNCAKHGRSGRPRLRARSPPEVRAGWSVPLAPTGALVSSERRASILPPPPITSRCQHGGAGRRASLALFGRNRPESASQAPRSPPGRRPRPSCRRGRTFGPVAYLLRPTEAAEDGRRCAGDANAGWRRHLCCWCVRVFFGVMAAVPGNRLLCISRGFLRARVFVRRPGRTSQSRGRLHFCAPRGLSERTDKRLSIFCP